MAINGKFIRTFCKRAANVPTIAFVLQNTNWFQSETVSIALYQAGGLNPWFFRNVTLKAGNQCEFSLDTVDWEWCQDDFAVLLGKNDRELQRWTLHIKEYGPGECPECHGTHKCKHCNGTGFVHPSGKVWEFKQCQVCGGTGTCQTCRIPRRQNQGVQGPTGLHPHKI